MGAVYTIPFHHALRIILDIFLLNAATIDDNGMNLKLGAKWARLGSLHDLVWIEFTKCKD